MPPGKSAWQTWNWMNAMTAPDSPLSDSLLPATSLPADVLAALQRGDTVTAIKLLRESNGLGLKEAREAVDAHLRGKPMPLAAREALNSQRHGTKPGVSPEISAEVNTALQQGNKLEAIRLLREKTGLDLAAAKEAVESIDARLRPGARRLSPGEVAGSYRGLWFVATIVVAVLAYYFLGR